MLSTSKTHTMSTYSNTETFIKDMQELAEMCGVTLDEEQLHVGGERAVMSPHKFVLTGKNAEGRRVVFKCAKHPRGVEEMRLEHNIRTALETLPFSAQNIPLPTETHSGYVNDFLVTITEFIEQEKVFAQYALPEQFFMSLQGLETQEAFHATTREHRSSAIQLFPQTPPHKYIKNFETFMQVTCSVKPEHRPLLERAYQFLLNNLKTLEVFDGYLMHTDFVPHNFRIKQKQLVLLDYSSFHFGNKYESWARFINYMEVHNPALVPLLTSYIKKDRGEFEYLDLRLMRVYKIGFLLHFYSNAFMQTEGNVHTLADIRLTFWSSALKAVLKDVPVPQREWQAYITARDPLRSETEKKRQREFNIV